MVKKEENVVCETFPSFYHFDIKFCPISISSVSLPCPLLPMEGSGHYGRSDHKQQSACKSVFLNPAS